MKKDMEMKLVKSDILIQKEKRVLLLEKLKSYFFIIVLTFLVLLLLIFLFWIFPNKDFGGNEEGSPQVIKVECSCTCDSNAKDKEVTPVLKNTQDNNSTNDHKPKKNKQNLSGGTYKNGTEFIKTDNHVHKRTWKNGDLVEDTTLEETIKESRSKSKENIPQLATPKQGK